MEKTETKDLNYYKNNCEEDYIKTPISVLRYISELEAAINYTHSCTELKDKEVLTFEEWLSNFEKTEDNNYWLNKEVLYCREAMLLHYNDLQRIRVRLVKNK